MDGRLDLNGLLIQKAIATFAERIAGESMTGAGLFPGDICVVACSLVAIDGRIVQALLGGEFTIKRYRCRGSRCWLQAETRAYAAIEIGAKSAFEVWGWLHGRMNAFVGHEA